MTYNVYLPKIIFNAAAKTVQEHGGCAILASGSWTDELSKPFNKNSKYNRKFSDHDATIFIPDINKYPTAQQNYAAMEEKIFNIKELFKTNVISESKLHNIPEKIIFDVVLTSTKCFSTPKHQNCFDSYSQFRKYTKLNINLNPDKKDTDKGIWKLGLMTDHFEKTGHIILLDKNGKLTNFRISNNLKLFYDYVKENNIHIAPKEPLLFTQKITILNEFIDILKENKGVHPRTYFKYLQRVQKFFFKDSDNDLFTIADDINKNNPKFEKIIKEEQLFNSICDKLMLSFTQLDFQNKEYISEKLIKKSLKQLNDFKEISLKMLKRPSLKGFRL